MTRLKDTSQIGETVIILLFSGPVAWENPGKKQEKNGMGRDYSLPLGKVLSSTEFQDFSRKSSKNNTT